MNRILKKLKYKGLYLLLSLVVGSVSSIEFLVADGDVCADSSLIWSGSMAQTTAYNFYTELLNKELPDCTNFLRTTLDLNLDYAKGMQSKGHNAVLVHATFRHKGYWGADAIKTEKGALEIGDVYGFAHSHSVAKPPLWMLSAWLDYSFDAFTSLKSDGLNRCRIGYFPFQLGRGIALGDSYGVSQDFLGVFVRSNDYYMPGCMIYGSNPDDWFSYHLYFARPEARSATVGQVLGLSKGHLLDNEALPFGGYYKDDWIGALQLDFSLDAGNHDCKRKSILSPYGFFFIAPDKKVDIDPDSSIELYTLGFANETCFDDFEVGFDVAVNRGAHRMKNVDLNRLVVKKDPSTGALVEYFSHILNDAGKPAVASDALCVELKKNLHRDMIPFVVDGVTYTSKNDRIRNSYINYYKGFMGVVDAVYKFPEVGFSVSAIAGYASGDTNPHVDQKDKDYKGFVGINEAYSSKRVPSLIVLGGACVKRPMTVDADVSGKLKDFIGGSFTDIIFGGTGFAFMPKAWSASKTKFAGNVLGFWKEHVGYKASDPSQKANRYLGTELNFLWSCEPIDSLVFSFKTAYFLPGGYYSDMKGALLDDATTKQLEAFDTDQIVSNRDKYSLGNNACYIFVFETKYSF